MTPTQQQPSEGKESINTPVASSPAVKIPMKKVEADGSVSEPKFPSEDDPAVIETAPKKKPVVVKQRSSKAVNEPYTIEEVDS